VFSARYELGVWTKQFSPHLYMFYYIICINRCLVWPLVHNHCRCRRLLLHLITFNDTRGWANAVISPWTRDRPVTQTSTWQHTILKSDRHLCPPGGFEDAIPANKRPQTYALDCAATGISQIDKLLRSLRTAPVWPKHVAVLTKTTPVLC